MDKREIVARAMWKSRNGTDIDDAVSPSLVEIYLGLADAAIAAIEPAPVSVHNWEGFARDLLESWPVRDVDGAELFDAALRNGLIAEVPGGYDPKQHIDADGICPETGDPWYEYTFRALAEKGEA